MKTSKRRQPLCDALPNFQWCMTIGMADDVPADIADRVIARKVFENCEKPLVFCCKDTNSVKDTYEMALLFVRRQGEVRRRRPPSYTTRSPFRRWSISTRPSTKSCIAPKTASRLINFPAPQCCGSSPSTFAGGASPGQCRIPQRPGGPSIGHARGTLHLRRLYHHHGHALDNLLIRRRGDEPDDCRHGPDGPKLPACPSSALPAPRMPSSATPRQVPKPHSRFSPPPRPDRVSYTTAAVGWITVPWPRRNSWCSSMTSSIRSTITCTASP